MADQSSKGPTNIILDQPFVLAKVKCYFYRCIHTSVYCATHKAHRIYNTVHNSSLYHCVIFLFPTVINASAYRLSPNYTVEVVAINSSALYVFFSPPVNNCNGVEHLSQSGFITDLADVTPDILLPALAEGTQAYIQTGLNASTQYFFYAVKLRANYTKTISGQRLAGAMTMDGGEH